MREYIVNLTNNLIGKHGFDLMFNSMKTRDLADGWEGIFVKLICDTISSRDVREMSPETLGKVMCSLEGSELPAYNPGLYFGKPDQYLRGIVSSFLAWQIRYRLDASALERHSKIPPYVSKNTVAKVHDSGFKAIIDGLAGKRTQKIHTTEDAVRLTLNTGFTNDDKGVMPEVLAYLKRHPEQVMEYGMQLQDAYNIEDRRTPMVKMALTLKSALK